MAPTRSSRASGADTDTSMADTSDHIRQLPVDPMVRYCPLTLIALNSLHPVVTLVFYIGLSQCYGRLISLG
jgi:hypothetical protein